MRYSHILLSLGALLLFSSGFGYIREEELECEQAVQYLSHCCPGFAIKDEIDCGSGDCHGGSQLWLTESRCIQTLNCDDLWARGLCHLTKKQLWSHEGRPVCQ